MQIGIFAPTTDYALPITEVAIACEQRGFDSLWVPEHTHIPTQRSSPFPGGGELPREYSHLGDPFVSLSAAAAVTESIRLGTGICLVIEHDPIILAKQVASLDRLSGGRFLFGVGAGWNREEMRNHGTEPGSRWKLLRERIEAMRSIWREDEAEFHGDLVDFDPIWSWPKPSRPQGPPVLLGSSAERSRQRVVEYCDGWIPVGISTARLESDLADLRERARQAGRDPDSIEVSLFWPRPQLETLKRLAELGVHRAVLAVVATEDRSALERRLDRYRQLAEQLG